MEKKQGKKDERNKETIKIGKLKKKKQKQNEEKKNKQRQVRLKKNTN